MAIVNEASILMQSRWDWADNTITGKWGTAQQVYRHRRQFVGEDFNEDNGELIDGYPVVITRNKVRGRGRSLHLAFTTEAGKDAHILGWSTNYSMLVEN